MDIDRLYADLLDRMFRYGKRLQTRNDSVRRVIAESVTFHSTPLISLRKTAWRNALREMEWFISGSHNINDLHPSVRSWWQPWASPEGWIPYNYGTQFRHYRGVGGYVDQIAALLEGVREHPHSRRNLVTTWNAFDMRRRECPITNCHGTIIQAFVADNRLDLVTYQRSVDVICGLPHNWLQYWAFLLWLAGNTGCEVGTLTWIGGDVHLYDTHEKLAERIIQAAWSPARPTPQLQYANHNRMFREEDFTLNGTYEPILTDRAEMIV